MARSTTRSRWTSTDDGVLPVTGVGQRGVRRRLPTEAGEDVVGGHLGHLGTRLDRGAADVWGHRELLRRVTGQWMVRRERLGIGDVEGSVAEPPLLECGVECVRVDDLATGSVDEDGLVVQPPELCFADEALGVFVQGT